MALTKRTIEAAQYTERDGRCCVLWDDNPRGLGLRVYPSGCKAFVLAYRAQRRKRMMTLGPYGVLTLDAARGLAKRKLADVIEGADPLAEKQKARRGATVKMLCDAYIERHAKPFKKTWTKDKEFIDRHIVPAWGTRQVTSIARADVADLHSKLGARRPYLANRLVALAGKMFECAAVWGYLPDNAANPARRIKKFPERKRDRWVTPEEMPRLAQAIRDKTEGYVQAVLWLYLLTGLRRSELLNLKRADIDWQRAELRLSDTKAGRPHYLPLSAPAMALLKEIPAEEGNDYLFPGRREGRPLVELKMAWSRVREAAGIPDVRIHDLRRTVGSWLANSGASLALIGRVLNHSQPTTTQIYARFQNDTVRQALEEHGRRVLMASDNCSQEKAA